MNACWIYCRSQRLNIGKVKPDRGTGVLHIAADSGIEAARALGVVPDVWVGDFDSSDAGAYGGAYAGVERITFPARKDKTDFALACEYAAARGCRNAIVVGGLDGRLDHTLACVFHLEAMRELGLRGTITNGYNRVSLLTAGERAEVGGEYKYVSLIPLRPLITGVYMEGFEYPLDDAEVTMRGCVSVSNQVVPGKTGIVAIGTGAALLVECDEQWGRPCVAARNAGGY